MDKSYLAKQMLQWEKLRRALDEQEAAIRDSVLELGQTVVTGNVRATYRKGRKTYDRMAAFYPGHSKQDAVAKAQEDHPGYVTEIITHKIDWSGLCKGMTHIPYTESDPSVSLKLEE